ncbi:UNVERIFIED_CONTAM: hypothetical protein Sradi_1897500 [Sesamum radiatum]|uniref:Transposase n=1 Tax=Sesamum radiatum TaxID=300843 RepID=A0AAW2U1V6_SESRA
MQEWCRGLRIKQRFTLVAHPQASGQVEVTNCILIQGIKRRIDRAGENWVEELISVLWAYRTDPERLYWRKSFHSSTRNRGHHPYRNRDAFSQDSTFFRGK